VKILTKDPGHDPVQTRIDIVQKSIEVYSQYLGWYDDKSSSKIRDELLRKIEREVKNLDLLKSKHPEYFI
jgi:hypothetical protein